MNVNSTKESKVRLTPGEHRRYMARAKRRGRSLVDHIRDLLEMDYGQERRAPEEEQE